MCTEHKEKIKFSVMLFITMSPFCAIFLRDLLVNFYFLFLLPWQVRTYRIKKNRGYVMHKSFNNISRSLRDRIMSQSTAIAHEFYI